jgi:hypothetical protein
MTDRVVVLDDDFRSIKWIFNANSTRLLDVNETHVTLFMMKVTNTEEGFRNISAI